MKPSHFVTPSPFRLIVAFLVAAMALLVLPGCVAVAAGAGAGVVAYVRGDLETTVPTDYVKVVEAARRALKDLEFTAVSDNKDALKAVIEARTALDKKVSVTLTNSGKRLTSIKIRVGIFGDEQLSLAILDKIKSGL